MIFCRPPTSGVLADGSVDQTSGSDEELDFEAFATGLGEWTSPGDKSPGEGAWTQLIGPTNTGSTGPAGGAAATTLIPTAALGHAYCETSGGPTSFTLQSPTIDASLGTVTCQGLVHMRFGNGTLTDGTFQPRGWNGSAWVNIGAPLVGSQQALDDDPYIRFEFDSSGFTNEDFHFGIIFVKGAGNQTFPDFNYDCAVDSLRILGPAGALVGGSTGGGTGGSGGSGGANRVGIIHEFSGADGVDGWPFGLNFADPEQAHNRANVSGGLTLAGTRSLQTEIRTNDPKAFVDRAPSLVKRRCEYTWSAVRYPANQVGYFGFYCRIPTNPMGNIRGVSIAQLHNFPESGETLQCSLFQGSLQFVGDGPSTNFVYTSISLANFNGTGLLDRRFKITCEFLAVPNNNGFMRIFVDDVQVVNFSGRTKPSGGQGPFFKHGLYHWGSGTPASNTTSIAVHDNITIGGQDSNLFSVDPDNFPRPGL